MADAWGTHDCKTVVRSLIRLLRAGGDLCENPGPPLMPRMQRYSLGDSAVVLPCIVLSCHVLYCLVMSCHVMSGQVRLGQV